MGNFRQSKFRFIVWDNCDNCGCRVPAQELLFRYSSKRHYVMHICKNCAHNGASTGEFSDVVI